MATPPLTQLLLSNRFVAYVRVLNRCRSIFTVVNAFTLYFFTGEDDFFQPTSGVITPAGGSIKTKHCQIVFPSNAVSETCVVTVTVWKDIPTKVTDPNVS